jgi:hypothetical protein
LVFFSTLAYNILKILAVQYWDAYGSCAANEYLSMILWSKTTMIYPVNDTITRARSKRTHE